MKYSDGPGPWVRVLIWDVSLFISDGYADC